MVALTGVGGYGLIRGRGQGIPHQVSANDLPVHVGQVQRHPVLDCGGRDVGHIVAVQRPDGLGGGDGLGLAGIAGGLGANGSVIQGQDAGIGAVIIVQRGRQLFQDLAQVLGAGLQGHRLGVVLAVRHLILLLHDVREGVAVALLLEGLLNELLGISPGGQGVGLDELLAPVEVLDGGVSGYLQGAGVGYQSRRQQQTGEQSFHLRALLFQKNTALDSASAAARVMGTMCFMCVFPP